MSFIFLIFVLPGLWQPSIYIDVLGIIDLNSLFDIITMLDTILATRYQNMLHFITLVFLCWLIQIIFKVLSGENLPFSMNKPTLISRKKPFQNYFPFYQTWLTLFCSNPATVFIMDCYFFYYKLKTFLHFRARKVPGVYIWISW